MLYAQERALVTLAGAFVALAFLMYMYFLCASVVNVVMRKDTDTRIAAVSSRITALQARYSDAEARITRDTAASLGLTTPVSKTYVNRKPSNLVLGKNDES